MNIRLLVAISFCIALSVGAARASPTTANPSHRGRHSVCRAHDTHCIAVHADVCDLGANNTVTDMCKYVQQDKYCKEDVYRIHYLALFYCHNKALMAVAGLFWMFFLFYVMTITAEMFLCPAIEFLVIWLRMSPDIAGVTLFAFASGAPDLFTQIAALAQGNHVDIELAVSATFGGGLFIICVVLSAVILSHQGGDIQIPDHRAYLRDAGAYLVASIIMLCLLWYGQLGFWTGAFLLVGYVLYLGLCFLTRSRNVDEPMSARYPTDTSAYIHIQQQQQQSVFGNSSMLPHIGDEGDLEMVPLTSPTAQDSASGGGALFRQKPAPGGQLERRSSTGFGSIPSSPATLSNGIGEGSSLALSPRALQLIKDGVSMMSSSTPASPGALGGELERSSSGPHESRSGGSNGLSINMTGLSLSGVGGSTSGSKPSPRQQSFSVYGPPLTSPRPWGTGGPGGAGWSGSAAWTAWIRSIPHALEEALHLHGKSGVYRGVALTLSPVVVIMHATMPATSHGSFTMMYGAALAAGFPFFFLLATPLGEELLSPVGVFATWAVAAALLFAALLVFVKPIAGQELSPRGTATHFNSNSSGINNGLLFDSSSWERWQKTLLVQRPRRNVVFAVLAFVQCIVWLNTTADEVVALFEAIGRVWNIRQDVLGATVLAWGETIPDLVAVLTLARTGQATMVVAAVFGGPVFNLLVSMGGPILFATAKNGSLPYHMTSGVVVLVGATCIALAFLLIVPPMRLGWKLTRWVGLVVLTGYAFSQVMFLAAEGHVVSKIRHKASPSGP